MLRVRAIAAATLAATIQFHPQVLRAETEALALDIHQVQRQNTSGGIDIAGTVAAYKTASLAAQIPGRVARIAGREGARFRQGEELVQIDDTALRAKLDAAHASRNAALAAMRNANVQLHRELNSPQSEAATNAPGGMGLPAMMDQMFTAPMQNVMGMRSNNSERFSDVIGRETQLTQAETQYRQAEAQIKEIQAGLRDARTLAPFNGVIETLYVEFGDTMQPGQPLLTFSETNAFQVHTDVPVRLRPSLSDGMVLPVRLDTTGPSIPARISRIFPVADRTQHTVRVEMDLPLETKATVGQYAEVQVPDPQSQGAEQLVIPVRSVIRKGGLPLVFAIGDDGLTKLRVVRLGGQAGPDGLIVLSGIHEGDRLVANPPPGLRAGTSVKDAATQGR